MRITRMALLIWIAAAVARGAGIEQKLTVYLRLRAPDRYTVTPLAQELAARMFSDIGISLEWKTREPAAGSSQPIIIELVSATPQNLMPGALAYALPYEGSHITVFLDRIETTESPAIVLAHVIVHEITHIVQRVSRHSETGVMKPHWTSHDYSEMRRRPLPFTTEDLCLIYNGLLARRGAMGALEVAR